MNGASTASSFWAQKRQEVKTPTAPANSIAASPKKNGDVIDVQPRIVLKGIANGANGTFTPKKTDWADSDDDEDFIASFSAKKNSRIIALETEVAQQVSQIGTLEAAASTKNARLTELEDLIEGKNLHIADLESNLEEKDTAIERLKTENHTQFLYVQELVGEVDEKSRRVHELESELDEKCVRIRELESQLGLPSESQSPVSEPVKTELPQSEHSETEIKSPTQDKIDVDVNGVPEVAPSDALPKATLSSDVPIDSIKKSPVQALPNKIGPTVNESKYPKLWSPDTPKKVAPVEKPKVLKMAIDTSKFVKKAPATTATKKPVQPNGNGILKPTYGQSTRHCAKTSVVPTFKIDKDIRHMSHSDRVLFANGPEVDVMLGSTSLTSLPKYILMQCSSKAYKYFTDQPHSTSISFPTGSMDVDAAMAHLKWMDEMTYQGRVYSITLHVDEKFDAKNLKICQAARVMGLNNTYVGHFTKIMCDRVRSNKATTDFLSLICELAVPENDPIFDCLANNLVNQQTSRGSHSSQVEELVAKYPHLKEQMTKIERRVQVSGMGDKRRGRFGSHGRDGGRERGVGGKESTAS